MLLSAAVLAIELWHVWLRLRLASSGSGYRAAGYAVSGYFASYSDGFIRRGLPGEFFSLLTPATPAAAKGMFWLLTGLTFLALIVIAVCFCVSLRGARRWLTLLIVLGAPFSLRGVADYLGHYDAVGLFATALLAALALRRGRLSALATGLVLVGAVALATLSEEFLFFFLAPVLVAFTLAEAPELGRRYRLGLAAALVCGLGLALASALTPVPAAVIHTAQSKAGASAYHLDAATFLGYTLTDEFTYMRGFGVANVVLGTLMWCVVFAVTLLALALLSGSNGRLYWLPAAYFTVLGAGLCLIGADWRRWWLLAFVSQLATVALLKVAGARRATPSRRPFACAAARRRQPGRLLLSSLAAALLLEVTLGFYTGVFPARSLGGAEYWKSDATYWLPGHHEVACRLGLSSSHC